MKKSISILLLFSTSLLFSTELKEIYTQESAFSLLQQACDGKNIRNAEIALAAMQEASDAVNAWGSIEGMQKISNQSKKFMAECDAIGLNRQTTIAILSAVR